MKNTLVLSLLALSQAIPVKERFANEEMIDHKPMGSTPNAPSNPIKPAAAWRGGRGWGRRGWGGGWGGRGWGGGWGGWGGWGGSGWGSGWGGGWGGRGCGWGC